MTATPTPVPIIERVRRATLGRYDIIATLGEGGMATVFLARDLALNRRVAIKVMHPALMTSPAALGRFRREARVAAALDHPHIIAIYSVGEDAELAYYVMRYLEGRSLHQVIAEGGALPLRRVIAIVDAIGSALHYAHRRGVIHRDVKPANIMVLDQDDWIVVTDFGIAKLDEGDHLTMSGHVVGTPDYMCPEYFNQGRVSAASDQYALGVVAYELLTGRLPFGGSTVGELMRGHILDAVPSVLPIRPDLPAGVDAALSRMLAKDPAARFVSVADAVAALKAAASLQSPADVATELIPTPVSGAGFRSARLASPSMVRARRARLAAAAIVSVIVVSLGTFAIRNGIRPPPAAGTTPPDAGITTPDAGTATPDAGTTPPDADTVPTPASRAPGSGDGVGAILPPAVATTPRGAPAPTTTTVLIGSRLPLTTLYVNGGSPRVIGELGIQTLSVAAGRVRIELRLDGCATWDTTFAAAAGSTHTVGYRAPRC